MKELKVELDNHDIGILLSFWLFLGFLTGHETHIEKRCLTPQIPQEEITNFIRGYGDDCFHNIERIFEKFNIPKEFALNCHLENMRRSGVLNMEEYEKEIKNNVH